MRKKKGGGEGGANWMDTYGDMVTLLLCFFVLLYSMSTISEEAWKNLVMSFNPEAQVTLHATPGGDGPSADADQSGVNVGDFENMSQADVEQQIDELYQALQNYISEEGAQSTISVTKGDGKVYVAFNQAVFFDGDDWQLREDSYPILDTVSGMLNDAKDAIEEIRIQGHTAQAEADVPNNPQTDRFLASNRATNVLVYIQEHCEIDPARLISEGFGQWRPVASNDDPESRAQNRRVEMIVSGRNIESELGEGVQQYTTE